MNRHPFSSAPDLAPDALPGALPVDAVLHDVAKALALHGRAILVAPPASGKSTRVPLFLAGLAPFVPGASSHISPYPPSPPCPGTILVLEPRRLAARTAARYMAQSLGQEAGQDIGFRVRLENRVSPRTRVEMITEGILTRRLMSDPELRGVSCVIFDEFHERSLQADLGLALCLEVQQALRPDLYLLLMSATLDTDDLAHSLAPCPVIRAEGRLWPVSIRHMPPPPSAGQTPDAARLAVGVAGAVRHALKEETGSVLVFLPGTAEIRRTEALLATPPLPANTDIHTLYGDLSLAAQDSAIAPCQPGRRKVVLSTALAESSLTIEGVRVVLDAGLARSSRYDPATDMNRLITARVSQDSADQRAGRAGRQEEGVCYRLWDKHEILAPHRRPEILEADLAPLLLACLLWGAQPESMPWLTAPPKAALIRARQTLTLLEALHDEQTMRLTKHGEALARLPLHPRLGHMVLRAGEHMALAACLAALISERDLLRGKAGADIRPRLSALRKHPHLSRMAEQIYAMLLPFIPGGKAFRMPGPEEEAFAGGLISLAWPERIAQRRQRGLFRLASGKGATLPDDDPLADAPFLAVAHMDAGRHDGNARIFLALPLEREALEALHAPRLHWQDRVTWNKREEALEACTRLCLSALVLEERPLGALDAHSALAKDARLAVLDAIRTLGPDCLPWTDELRQWQARVNLLHALEPDMGWPDVKDRTLFATLEQWLEPYLDGVSRRDHFRRIPLASALHSLLARPLAQTLDKRLEHEAPCRITVPSGGSAPIDYRPEGGPVLAVKLQEMFGQSETPTIASGRIALVLHLLSPAGRPLQVTRDLHAFWANGYKAVRAEMRGRYPRHPWPDNPLLALPTAKTKKKMARP